MMADQQQQELSPLLYWKNPCLCENQEKTEDRSSDSISSLCIGTGRFLRSVLVPLLECQRQDNDANKKKLPSTVLVQPRGRSFVDFMSTKSSDGSYPVDTVNVDGSTRTDSVEIAGAFSWGTNEAKQGFYKHLPLFGTRLQVIGVGVTESGLASPHTSAMQNLFDLFQKLQPIHKHIDNQKVVVLNTDNVPGNGQVIRRHLMSLLNEKVEKSTAEETEWEPLRDFLSNRVAFLDTMVDRIVSHREGDALVPRAEPTPAKAVVVLDPEGDLPDWFVGQQNKGGLVIRQHPHQLQADVAWKLRIANATHTAVAHLMALSGFLSTTELSSPSASLLMDYLDHLVEHQILPACISDPEMKGSDADADVQAVWNDWRKRLTHPTFGMSTFFVTQNGAAKGGIRFGPTLWSLCSCSKSNKNTTIGGENNQVPLPQASLAFAVAVLLRWLTPSSTFKPCEIDEGDTTNQNRPDLYCGDLVQLHTPVDSGTTTVTYADGLRYNLAQGWYEFRCDCPLNQQKKQLAEWLQELQSNGYSALKREDYEPVVDAYLQHTVVNSHQIAKSQAWKSFVGAVATLYARLVAGEAPLTMLQEMLEHREGTVFAAYGCKTPCNALVDGPH